MAKDTDHELPYLTGKPSAFVDSADVLLVLDSGEELPVHSTFLSARSDVLSNMLSLKRQNEGKLQLPFPNCCKESACALLKYLYALDR